METHEIAIIGAGIAGLTAAYILQKADFLVFESADYVGGRTRSIRQSASVWANFGAQYISSDRPRVVQMADELGVHLQTNVDFLEWTHRLESAAYDIDEIMQVVARIQQEQSHPRSPTLPELDDVPFAQWLGEVSPSTAQFFEDWCQLLGASSVETSLYGALWLWGAQRTTPWATEEVETHDRGHCLVVGGTGELAAALGKAIGDRIRLVSRVILVEPAGAGYRLHVDGPRGVLQIATRRVICAVPAPVAANIINGLPAWKRQALEKVRYGRWITAPIFIAPKGSPSHRYPLTCSRPGVSYSIDNFTMRTPSDMDTIGGCYHCMISDASARQVWDDPDDTIKTGAARALLKRFPEYAHRITGVEIQKWRYGTAQYSPGRMKVAEALAAPCANIYFCGDYTLASNLEGAVRSGERAARELLAAAEE